MSKEEFQFNFIDFKLLAVHFEVNRDFSSEDNVEVTTQLTLNHDCLDEHKILRVFLKVEIYGKDTPFSLTVEGAGLFQFNSNLPKKDALTKIAHINCASIVFPYVRETIADITRRSGFPPLHIAPVNFVDFFEKNHQKKH